MNIRTLNEGDFQQLHQAFNLAFADNKVSFQLSEEDFSYRLKQKVQIAQNISAAAFDGNELVGFIMHASNLYQGVPTAYNAGTGVLPGFRNQQTAEQIYGFLIPRIQSKFMARILLEVVENNHNAIALYEKLGFEVKRKFKCYKQMKSLESETSISIKQGALDDVDFTFSDFEPSFIDSEAHLKQGNESVLLANDSDGSLMGYLIMQPHLGRISQLAVSRLHRHKKVGEGLLRAAVLQTKKPLTIMNIPDGESGFHLFLKRCGFENQVNQYEMELTI